MKGEQIKLVPYKDTLYGVFLKEIKGKYFQNILTPHLIFQIPEKNQIGIHYIEKGKLSVWFPLLEKSGEVSLDEFNNYALISEDQFKKYKEGKVDLLKILLAHEGSQAIKESSQADPSTQKATEQMPSTQYPLEEGAFGPNIPFKRGLLSDLEKPPTHD